MTKFSNKLKNPVLAHFRNFWGQKNSLENPALSRTTSNGILAPCQNLEKINDTIPKKRRDRRKDRQTLFHRTLPATPGAPKNVPPSSSKKLKNINGLIALRILQILSST